MLHKLFSWWRGRQLRESLLSLAKGRSQPFSKTEMETLVGLLTDKRFPLFLELLELTVSDKLYIYSSIDISTDEGRVRAIKIQNYTQGVLSVRDLVESLIAQAETQNSHLEEDKE